jgi:hypothetical protein
MLDLDLLMSLLQTNLFTMSFTDLREFTLLLDALNAHEWVENLVAELRASADAREKIERHIFRLLAESTPHERRYPVDSIVTTYLYALYKADSDRAYRIARKIVALFGLFWARRMAQHILAEMQQTPH